MKNKYSGKCLCGAVTYEVDGQPIVVAQCHCDECRRLSGTGHTIGAMFTSDAVTLSGTLSEFKYMSDKASEVTKAFCAHCGSPIYGTNTRMPDHLTLTLGSMDDASGLHVQAVIFEHDKQHWSLTSLRDRMMKNGAKAIRYARSITLQLAEVAVPRDL